MMKDTSARSAIRAFKVLELLDERREPLRLKDFVERLEAPTSSIAELLKILTEAGYLTFDTKTRSYLPTSRVTAFGDWLASASPHHARILEAMQRMSDKCGELIFLGAASGIHVHYTEMIPSTLPIQMVVERGAKRLLVRSGMGWALLSAHADPVIEKIYSRTAQLREIRRKELPLQTVLERVREVREKKIIYSRNTVYGGAGVIATLLPLVEQGRHLALGVAGPTSRLDEHEETFRKMLLAEAARLRRSAARD